MVTALICAAYSELLAQFDHAFEAPGIETLPWAGIAAAIIVLALGSWLWLDHVIDNIGVEFNRVWLRSGVAEPQSGDTQISELSSRGHLDLPLWDKLEPSFVRYSERIEAANEFFIIG